MEQDIETILLTQEQIQQRVRELGEQITRDYQDKDPIIVGILRGCFIFMADLVRATPIPCTLEFLAVSSYGQGTTSGEVCLTRDFPMPIEGRHVLILEDILDSGRTLDYVVRLLRQRGPASVEICTFLRWTFGPNTSAIRSRTPLWWAMAWTMPTNTGTCLT